MFFELRVAVGRQHLAVRIDVDAAVFRLLEQKLHIVQVVAADDDERAFFDGERHLRGDGVASKSFMQRRLTSPVLRTSASRASAGSGSPRAFRAS